MNMNFFLLVNIFFAISCSFSTDQSSEKRENRKEIVIKKHLSGQVKKTFDGYTYRVYDKKGRMIEHYGNRKLVDANSNFRTQISYEERKVVVKEYVFDDTNTSCKIINKNDFVKIIMYFDSTSYDESISFEIHKPVFEDGNYTKHELFEIEKEKDKNYYLRYLPNYLR